MHDWRFDDLTRTLGRATSRRQVLKGLLVGVAAALVGRSVDAPTVAAAGSCDAQACQDHASQLFEECLKTSQIVNGIRGGFGHNGSPNESVGRIVCGAERQLNDLSCNRAGCIMFEQCCGNGCTDIRSDANNCGACGHVCPEGAICRAGHCVCPDNLIRCGDASSTPRPTGTTVAVVGMPAVRARSAKTDSASPRRAPSGTSAVRTTASWPVRVAIAPIPKPASATSARIRSMARPATRPTRPWRAVTSSASRPRVQAASSSAMTPAGASARRRVRPISCRILRPAHARTSAPTSPVASARRVTRPREIVSRRTTTPHVARTSPAVAEPVVQRARVAARACARTAARGAAITRFRSVTDPMVSRPVNAASLERAATTQ